MYEVRAIQKQDWGHGVHPMFLHEILLDGRDHEYQAESRLALALPS
jgi:hypothetical protein